jgi:hypothetical protein
MLKLSLGFVKSLATLPSERMKKVPKFMQMLYGNPNLPSLRLKRLATADLYSARLDDGYRAILARRGADYILLRVDKHDGAYHWAERGIGSYDSTELPVEDYLSTDSNKVEDGPPPDYTSDSGQCEPTSNASRDSLEVGSIHSWDELRRRFDWDLDKHGYFLPEKNGRIVCACLRAHLNPSAPWEILVGKAAAHIRKAELLAREPVPIPIFIKLAVDQWEYWGLFRFERCEKNPDKIRGLLPKNRLADTSMVLFLSDAG